MNTISISDAKSRFSELVSRAAGGERFIIQRRERPLAVLISPADLQRLERAAQTARRLALALGQDEGILREIEAGRAHPAMAAFGLWDDAELDQLSADVYANRERQAVRSGVAF
jgi:prevent-host-death family protein